MKHIRVPALILIGLFCIACGGPSTEGGPAASGGSGNPVSRLARMKETGTLRIGWAGYPPYVVGGNSSGQVSGLAVDLITRIIQVADKSIKIEWVPTKFDRLLLDLQSDKFDLVVEPLIQTMPRALQLGISAPYTFIGYGIPVVRAQEARFKSSEDIDRPGLTVAVTSTASSHQYAQRVIRQADVRALPAGSLDQPLLEVIAGRADAALADEVTIRGYLAQHPGVARALSIEAPPEKLGAGFVFPQGDYALATFLNAGIAYMQTTGELKRLAQRYQVPYFEPAFTRVEPGP